MVTLQSEAAALLGGAKLADRFPVSNAEMPKFVHEKAFSNPYMIV
jgi:hypothetical protein